MAFGDVLKPPCAGKTDARAELRRAAEEQMADEAWLAPRVALRMGVWACGLVVDAAWCVMRNSGAETAAFRGARCSLASTMTSKCGATRRDKLTEREREAEQAFEQFDDGDGYLTVEEVRRLLEARKIGAMNRRKSINVLYTNEEAIRLRKALHAH